MASTCLSSTPAQQRTYIEDLQPNDMILQTDDNWKFNIREDLWTRSLSRLESLGIVRSLALGLTEMCASIGTGMVSQDGIWVDGPF